MNKPKKGYDLRTYSILTECDKRNKEESKRIFTDKKGSEIKYVRALMLYGKLPKLSGEQITKVS